MEALPVAFSNKAAIVQATGSHTLKPGMRLRLWFWLTRPMAGTELKRWLAASPVDRSVFGAAQPIYTASPLFIGRPDPLPSRFALLPGGAEVQPPSQASLEPAPRPPAWRPRATDKAAAPYALASLEQAVARILTAHDRHPTIVQEARGLARLVDAGLLTGETVANAIHEAARAIGKDDESEIDKILEWAAQHSTGTATKVCHHAR
jgi:hypothetical protein